MKKTFKQKMMIVLGWFFVILGVIGALLPVMPTTVFLIIALSLFSKSSQHFRNMLLNNRFFGEDLLRWEKHKAISRPAKKKATAAIIITFGLSIAILNGRLGLQVMLITLALVLLTIIWSIKE